MVAMTIVVVVGRVEACWGTTDTPAKVREHIPVGVVEEVAVHQDVGGLTEWVVAVVGSGVVLVRIAYCAVVE